jgi:predicted Zn-dependent protease
MRLAAILGVGFLISGCVSTVEPVKTAAPSNVSASVRAETAARQFAAVVAQVEPVAEAQCRQRAPRLNCDYQIVVDDRPNQAPNAFQTITEEGRPIIAFNIPLILTVENSHELAFVMGHEAAHHIAGHLEQTRQNATIGAVIFSGIAAMTGANAQAVQSAEQLGATVGARTYSKDFELEADVLGARIAYLAGYDPAIGVQFFDKLPDPGNKFLGSHPPNSQRVSVVKQAIAGL